MSSSKDRDAFFTKREVAERFVRTIDRIVDLDQYDNVIEPAAGDGALLDYLPEHNRIGYDLVPCREDIIEQDFYQLEFPEGRNAVVMNPPFGRASKMAMEFFNKCADNAEVIATIIPRSWNKYRTHKKLNENFGLYYSVILPDNSFELDGKDYAVRCVGQLWIRKDVGDVLSDPWEGFTPYDSWNDDVPLELLQDIDKYQEKHGCYERY